MFRFLIVLGFCLISVDGHGYLYEPVARSSAWLVDPSFKECCTYPQHMEMFCGGIGHQYNVNDGKCSICGEPYDKPVKEFEKGGAMYTGKIVKTYTQGQQIDVKVILSANHRGYFEFRLCNLDASPLADATQECLDRHQLLIAGTNSTKFGDVGHYGSSMISLSVQLPPNIACKHCVFQWKYTAANSWGTDPVTGESGLGLGIENETFMGCSDITILPNGSPTEPPTVIIPTPTPATTTRKAGTSSSSPKTGSPTASPSNLSTWWPTTISSSIFTWWPTVSSSSQNASSSTISTTPRPPLGLTTWSSEFVDYQIGDEVMYDGEKYRCVAPHRSFPGAEPGILTWAWWQRVDEEATSDED